MANETNEMSLDRNLVKNQQRINELEKQLELKESTISNLKKVIEQKDELWIATNDKVLDLEQKKTDIEEALVNLTIDEPGGEDSGGTDEADTFVSSTSRAAQLEAEKNDFRIKLAKLSTQVIDFCTKYKNNESEFNLEEAVKSLEESLNTNSSNSESQNTRVSNHENVQLQVKMELEHERRLRTQVALDDSEKKQVALKREAENKAGQCQDLQKQLSNMKEKHEVAFKKVSDENRRLEKLLKVKEGQICESEIKAKDLSLRAEEFEILFNGQLSSVKALQADLTVASNENRALVKEMEMLNHMFNSMERQYVSQASNSLESYKNVSGASSAEGPEEHPKDSSGQDIIADDVLKAVSEQNFQDFENISCFREMTTKNGTRMVLSVSKTFMKLKDLILEKKTLIDQVEKMKTINAHLCSRVSSHEDKLFNITDELNKTWTFVSTMKQQHKKLHENEQILRSELTEKRELLAKLRQELEYTRETWNVVKVKTADSEREWHALRAEFAARRKLFKSAYHLCSGGRLTDLEGDCDGPGGGADIGGSESSDCASDETGEISAASAESGFATDNQNEPELLTSDNDNENQNDTIPTTIIDTSNGFNDQMTESTMTIKNDDNIEEPEVEEIEAEMANFDIENISILIPTLDFFAEVPPELFPPLLPHDGRNEEKSQDSDFEETDRDRQIDGQYSSLYQRLMASTARSTALANRLAVMQNRTSLEGSPEEDGDGESDYEPRTEEDSIVANSPDIISEIASEVAEVEGDYVDEDEDEEELEDLGLSPEAIEQALASSGRNFDDSDSETDENASTSLLEESQESGVESDSDAASELAIFQATPNLAIPAPPPQPTFSLLPPPARVTVRPTYNNYANVDSGDSSDDEDEASEAAALAREEAAENATTVTRFLIKHLPKQLSQLRHDKSELEDKIRDLDTLVSNQNVAMTEMERRIEVYKKEAETARKWSASLANLHHIKVNTAHIPPMTRSLEGSMAFEDTDASAMATASTALTASAASAASAASRTASRGDIEGDLSADQPYEMIELPITVTKGNVKMMWKILCAAPNTIGFVAYRPPSSSPAIWASPASTASSFDFAGAIPPNLATYIQSGIALHPNDYSEIEVEAQSSGFYVLQLRSTRISMSDVTYEFSLEELHEFHECE